MAVLGAAVAFAANALSPHRIELGRDYFAGARHVAPGPPAGTNTAATAAGSTNSPQELLAAHLRDIGLQLADSNQVVQFFHDPRREQDGIIFIDAREDEQYLAGHIPGAYQFYHFYPEKYITSVSQPCLTAEPIIFYCNGGECDLSLEAAVYLRDNLRLPKEKLFVYGGGFGEWVTNGLPVELGQRNSGQLTNLVRTAAGPKAGALKP